MTKVRTKSRTKTPPPPQTRNPDAHKNTETIQQQVQHNAPWEARPRPRSVLSNYAASPKVNVAQGDISGQQGERRSRFEEPAPPSSLRSERLHGFGLGREREYEQEQEQEEQRHQQDQKELQKQQKQNAYGVSGFSNGPKSDSSSSSGGRLNNEPPSNTRNFAEDDGSGILFEKSFPMFSGNQELEVGLANHGPSLITGQSQDGSITQALESFSLSTSSESSVSSYTVDQVNNMSSAASSVSCSYSPVETSAASVPANAVAVAVAATEISRHGTTGSMSSTSSSSSTSSTASSAYLAIAMQPSPRLGKTPFLPPPGSVRLPSLQFSKFSSLDMDQGMDQDLEYGHAEHEHGDVVGIDQDQDDGYDYDEQEQQFEAHQEREDQEPTAKEPESIPKQLQTGLPEPPKWVFETVKPLSEEDASQQEISENYIINRRRPGVQDCPAPVHKIIPATADRPASVLSFYAPMSSPVLGGIGVPGGHHHQAMMGSPRFDLHFDDDGLILGSGGSSSGHTGDGFNSALGIGIGNANNGNDIEDNADDAAVSRSSSTTSSTTSQMSINSSRTNITVPSIRGLSPTPGSFPISLAALKKGGDYNNDHSPCDANNDDNSIFIDETLDSGMLRPNNIRDPSTSTSTSILTPTSTSKVSSISSKLGTLFQDGLFCNILVLYILVLYLAPW